MTTMKSTLAAAVATALIASGASMAGAQTPSTPSTTTTPPATSAPPSSSTPSASSADMMGKHSMDGEVTRVDSKKGWVHVKTSEGTMIMYFPPSDLASVKKGDRINVSLALKDNGPASPASKDTPPRKTTR